MLKEIFQGIADAITSELFPKLFILSIVMFLLGLIVGYTIIDIDVKTQCDQMSITEAFKYPYCRNYFEEQLKNMED